MLASERATSSAQWINDISQTRWCSMGGPRSRRFHWSPPVTACSADADLQPAGRSVGRSAVNTWTIFTAGRRTNRAVYIRRHRRRRRYAHTHARTHVRGAIANSDVCGLIAKRAAAPRPAPCRHLVPRGQLTLTSRTNTSPLSLGSVPPPSTSYLALRISGGSHDLRTTLYM